jgi:hypothetical protein
MAFGPEPLGAHRRILHERRAGEHRLPAEEEPDRREPLRKAHGRERDVEQHLRLRDVEQGHARRESDSDDDSEDRIWSYLLDVPAIMSVFMLPGGAWIC